MEASDFEKFFQGYLECALFTSTDDEGNPLDYLNCSIDDFPVGATAVAMEECLDFTASATRMLREATKQPGYSWSSAGHDFWLTRNGHGAGYWDRGLPGALGDKLSDKAHAAGGRNVMLMDDGSLYFEQA